MTTKNDYSTFYMVLVEGTHYTSVVHPTYEEALTEAKRLTRNEGKAAFILQAREIVECVPHYNIGLLQDA